MQLTSPRALLALPVLILAGCPFGGGGGGEGRPRSEACQPTDLAPPAVRLLESGAPERPLSEGAELEWEDGFQGGQHIYLDLVATTTTTMRAAGASNPSVELELWAGRDQVGQGGVGFEPCPTGQGLAVENLRVVLWERRAMDVRVEVELFERYGDPAVAATTANVRVVAPPE